MILAPLPVSLAPICSALTLVLVFLSLGATRLVHAAEPAPGAGIERIWFGEKDLIVIEAEATLSPLSPAGWERVARADATGGAAVVWRGASTWMEGPKGAREYRPFTQVGAVLTYRFELKQPGRFWIKLLNRHAREDGDNDVWVSVNGGAYGKYYDWAVEQWTWDETGAWGVRELPAGVHTLEIAGRSTGFHIDRIVIYRDGATPLERWTDLTRGQTCEDRTLPHLAQASPAGVRRQAK